MTLGAISVIVKHRTLQRFVTSSSFSLVTSTDHQIRTLELILSRVHRAAICVTAQSADARVDAMTSVWVLAAALPTAASLPI